MDKTTDELTKELEEARQQRDQYLAGWQRERADLLNYKKDEMERIRELITYANAEFLLKVFPILDNVERALQNISGKDEATMQGLSQIQAQAKDFLKSQGIIEVPIEGKFNPEFHETVEEVESEGKTSGDIAEVVEKGYTMGGKLIRPAKVKIVK